MHPDRRQVLRAGATLSAVWRRLMMYRSPRPGVLDAIAELVKEHGRTQYDAAKEMITALNDGALKLIYEGPTQLDTVQTWTIHVIQCRHIDRTSPMWGTHDFVQQYVRIDRSEFEAAFGLSGAEVTGAQTPKPASESRIRKEITALYDEAGPVPNLNRTATLIQARLLLEGLIASQPFIKKLAAGPTFSSRRRKSGSRLTR